EMFNSAFTVGGARCTIATVQKLTGIAVTHFVQLDFAGFRSMVDALGTVPICSQKAVDDPKSKLTLHKGINNLGGRQALAFVRTRESLGDGSDLGRIKRQQLFMGVVLRQAMSGTLLSNPVRLTDFLDAATKAITVDSGTSFGDLRQLASAMHGLNPKHVTFYTAPIANRDYSPPGSGLSGKVLLDDHAGKVLYEQIIHDGTSATTAAAKPSRPASSSSVAKTSTTPKPDANAAQQTCKL
ncbi:MAG: LCP family protein, partial [Actinomycetota bacterium]|nr:LCP family protein [Actinomycetota bacterium]